MSSKGRVVVPAEFRKLDRIEPGQEFEVERLDCGDYRLTRRPAPQNEGVVDWLLACPHKNFFVSIESESADTMKYLVDATVLSEPTKPSPDSRVVASHGTRTPV